MQCACEKGVVWSLYRPKGAKSNVNVEYLSNLMCTSKSENGRRRRRVCVMA